MKNYRLKQTIVVTVTGSSVIARVVKAGAILIESKNYYYFEDEIYPSVNFLKSEVENMPELFELVIEVYNSVSRSSDSAVFSAGDKVYYVHKKSGKHFFTITAFAMVNREMCAYEGMERPYMAGTPVCSIENLIKDDNYEQNKELYYTEI